MSNLKDLTGQTFGRLTVIERAENNKYNQARWKCSCECGNITIVQSANLIKGTTKSCGCLKKEIQHHKSNTRLFSIWASMKKRCYNPKHNHYDRYGGRGIAMCEDWQNNFLSFYNWALTNGYNDNLTIDRIDNNGNYCPENCKWNTKKDQVRNRSCTRLLTYNGKTQSIAQWADEIGIKYSTLSTRLRRNQWNVEKALKTQIKK